MAERIASAALRGFLVHESLVNLDNLAVNDGSANGSDYSEADGQPGSPVPADPRSTYLPHVHNAQPTDIDVLTLRGGIPRRGGLPANDGAALSYRETGEADTAYRGWNEPNLVTGYRPVEWSTSDVIWTHASAVTIPSNQQVVVGGRRASTTARSWARDPTTRDWNPDAAIGPIAANYVCCYLQSRIERVVAIVGSAGGAIDAFYSDDAGVSWSAYATQLIVSPLPSSALDVVAAIEDRNGNVLFILVNGTTGAYEQWVSTDAGVTFQQVDTGTNWALKVRLQRLADGRILVAYQADTATLEATYIVLQDAFDQISAAISGATDVQFDGTTRVDSLAIVVDDDGVVYAYLQRQAFTVDSAQTKVFRSIDDAASFVEYDTVGIYTNRGGGLAGVHQDLTHHLLAAAPSGGEIVILATPEYDPTATPPTTDGSLVAITMGGWASDEAPGLPLFGRMTRAAWGPGTVHNGEGSVWLPTQTFAYQNWDDTASGGPLEVDPVPTGFHRFTTVADESWAEYSDNSFEDCATFFGELAVNGGASGDADHGRLRFSRCDGVDEAGIRIGAVSTHFRIRDYVGNALLTAQIAADMVDDLMQFMVVFSDLETASVYYKRPSSSLWIAAVENVTLTTQALANIGNTIRAGTPSAAVTATVTVGLVAMLFASSSQGKFLRGLVDAGNREQLVWGKPIGPAPYPVRDQVGEYSDSPVMRLSASGGSAHEREAFSIPAVFDHGIRHVLPQLSPSPDAYWSSTDNVEQILTWDLGADSRLGHSWAVGLCLVRTNFRQAVLEARTAAGVTSTLGTYDAIVGTSLSFVRSGNIVEPAATGASAPRFWQRGELAGGFIIFDPGGAPVARRLLWNEGGGWQPGLGVKPVLRVELLGGEPTSGTCHVIAPSGVLVCHRSAPTAYRYVRIRIPVQTTVSAVFEIGQVILGALVIPGRQWSRGWSWRYSPNTRVEVDDYGTQWADPRGPLVRELTVSWQDGNDYSAISRGPDVPYLSAAAGMPGLAADQDIRFQLAGLLGETEGASLPVVALPSVPPQTETIADRSMWLYGILQARMQANNVQGDDGVSELGRVESLTVREQV